MNSNKVFNIIKQFGYLYLIKSLIKRILSPLVKFRSYEVLVIDKHSPEIISNDVKIITGSKISEWRIKSFITDKLEKKFRDFIERNSIGYYIEIEHELAAWGFVQTKGLYKYGSLSFDIPKGVHVLKNLYVRPRFRGASLGKILNEARINSIPQGNVPCGFVISENKYAKRNLQLYGFQEYVNVHHTIWLNKYSKTRIEAVHGNNFDNMIMNGFKTS